MSDWLVKRVSSGKITAISVSMTAIALFGFSISKQYWMLLLWAIPYGLGAGGVDAVLNTTNEEMITFCGVELVNIGFMHTRKT